MMERKTNILPGHLRYLGLPENTKGIIGKDASDCSPDCPSLKINAQGKKVCEAVIIYTPELTIQSKTEPKN